MKKLLSGLFLSLFVIGCGSKETYKEQIERYNLLVAEANTYNDTKKFDKALFSSNKAVEITDTLAPALLERGNANLGLNKWDDANDDFSDAIDLEGEKSAGYKGRAIANYFNDEKGDFIDDISNYINHFKNDVYAHSLRADYYIEKQDYDEAIVDYSICLRNDPNNASFYLKRGNAYAMAEQNNKSILDYENYTRLTPDKNNDQIFYKSALLNSKIGQYQKAINDLLLISNNNRKPAVQKLIGDNYTSLRDYTQAVKNYSTYLRMKPKDYLAYKKRGDSYMANNEVNLANADFKTGALLQWGEAGIIFKYGWWILFAIVYFVIGQILFVNVKEEYDNKKIRKGYWYYSLSGFFGGHHAYTKSINKFLLLAICILSFTFINSFNVMSYYNRPDLLWLGILETPYSLYLLYGIVILLLIDAILLPYYIFSENHALRKTITDEMPKQRRSEIDSIEVLIKQQNTNLKKLNS